MRASPGRSIPLSRPRRLIGDLMHFARQVPSIPVQRLIDVATVRAARQRLAQRPAWSVIFTKAFALVAQRCPELRRSYLAFPWARLYEHTLSVASIAVERAHEGENAVLFGQLRAPDQRGLAELDADLRHLRTAPIAEIEPFRRALWLSGLPWPMRWSIWWLVLKAWGRKRARYFGTFGVSVYAATGSESLHPISPLTIVLNYGVIQADGTVAVRLVYDHRVLDGSTVARALAALEAVLHTEIVAELNALAASGTGMDEEAAA